jgi:hypothetical protein
MVGFRVVAEDLVGLCDRGEPDISVSLLACNNGDVGMAR